MKLTLFTLLSFALSAVATPVDVAERDLERRAQPQGIDVSGWQGNVDWTAVKNAGISFAYVKATEVRLPLSYLVISLKLHCVPRELDIRTRTSINNTLVRLFYILLLSPDGAQQGRTMWALSVAHTTSLAQTLLVEQRKPSTLWHMGVSRLLQVYFALNSKYS